MIANPAVLEDRDDGTRALAKVDVNAEWDWARTALQGLQVPTLLANHAAAAGPPTRTRLLAELAATNDIVYIVCYGALGACPRMNVFSLLIPNEPCSPGVERDPDR